jgi:hypothetical protein
MSEPLTRTEAETLATMLNSAAHKMSRVKTAWPDPYAPIREMCEGFYDIVPATMCVLL